MYAARGQTAPMVEVDAGDYLLSELFECGPDKAVERGRVPLSAQDVWFHCLNSGLNWEAWERKALVSMSRAYIEGLSIGADPFGIPPIEIEDE